MGPVVQIINLTDDPPGECPGACVQFQIARGSSDALVPDYLVSLSPKLPQLANVMQKSNFYNNLMVL
jgi:hypothetical protein